MSTFCRQLSTLELSGVKLITKIDSNLLEALVNVSEKASSLLYK